MRKYPASLIADVSRLREQGLGYGTIAKQLGVTFWEAYRSVNAEKQNARDLVTSAIKSGKISKPPVCEVCGSARPEAHHADYTKPLLVKWICRACHRREHDKIKFEQTMQARSTNAA